MALSESQRLELYEYVKQSSLGKAGADIVMTAIPTIDWTDLATHDDLALLRAEIRGEMAELRGDVRTEIGGLETRLQRSIVTWILAAQGVTLATIGGLLSVMMIVLA